MRRYIAAADRSETCCSRMILTSAGNPGRRPQIGGSPSRAWMRARSLSRAARWRAPSLTSARVRERALLIPNTQLPISNHSQLPTPNSQELPTDWALGIGRWEWLGVGSWGLG